MITPEIQTPTQSTIIKMTQAPTVIVRPIQRDDLPNLMDLIHSIRSGIPSLPKYEEPMQARIEKSIASFNSSIAKPGKENYLFVIENADNNKLVGCSGIKALINGEQEYYTYKIKKERNTHDPLGINVENQALHLSTIDNVSEMCSLFLERSHRYPNHGRLLSYSRFIFMNIFAERFCDTAVSDLRGYLDDNDESPFWESFGRRLIHKDIGVIDIFEGRYNQAIIQDLIPQYPIYLSLLSKEARDTIGKTYPSTEPALSLLKEQGFKQTNFINIYDAGPFLRNKISNINIIKNSRSAPVSKLIPENNTQEPYIICNHDLNFQATLGYLEEYPDNSIGLPSNIAQRLDIGLGDILSFSNILKK